ncbi:hypothetical protein AMECASPLE_010346 [Ameca splendens]|uniref:Uncharacterized protein n=1 Tax=Ameca splendens TaxID=208324 RepID=A0ABV0YZ77_9TELE
MQSQFFGMFSLRDSEVLSGCSCTSMKLCPVAFPVQITTDSLLRLTVEHTGLHRALKVHFSRINLAHHTQEERPSGDPKMRLQRPQILTHQDIRFSEASRQGHEANRESSASTPTYVEGWGV